MWPNKYKDDFKNIFYDPAKVGINYLFFLNKKKEAQRTEADIKGLESIRCGFFHLHLCSPPMQAS